MAKYILRKTAIFIGDKYFPEESIIELKQREAEKINQSISVGVLEKLSEIETGKDIPVNEDILNESSNQTDIQVDKKLQSVREGVDLSDSIEQVSNRNISTKNGRKVSQKASSNNHIKKRED
ncbi:MAG: hypothetical protein WC055_04420 [Melioribacteraceae bacterium]